MASRTLFGTAQGTRNGLMTNEAGGVAFRYTPKSALAQYALTGCLNRTFYASDKAQLDAVLSLCKQNDPEYVAKVAVYAREKGHMKDVPALLCVYLAATRNHELLGKVFPRVINNGKMLRNFVQILRSGVTGRKSLGTTPKRMVRNWLDSRTPTEVFLQSVGGSPTFRDILRLAHPKPADRQRNALYGWLVGRNYNAEYLPSIVQEFEAWKKGTAKETPDVPFDMLTAQKLGPQDWAMIARRATWLWLLKNLNTMLRQGVFGFKDVAKMVAEKLADPDLVRRSRCFPYQIMTAFVNADPGVPAACREALQDALEVATGNVPEFPGELAICADVSGSMTHPVTGNAQNGYGGRFSNGRFHSGSTTKVRCVEVAALMACCLLRKNPKATLLAFKDKVVDAPINPRDTVLTNAARVAGMAGGATACSAPLAVLNAELASGKREKVDAVVMVSDNQSWLESLGVDRYGRSAGKTAFQTEWEKLKGRCPEARMVCLDIAPYGTAQNDQSRDDILNVGGFSDTLFPITGAFLSGQMEGKWVELIEDIEL